MSTTNILDLNNRMDALEKNSGGGGSADSAKRSDIATEFSATTAYTAGCFVYYEGKLYQFNADHAAGAWDPTDVVEANVTDQIVSNASAIAGLTASDVAYDNTTSGLSATNEQAAIDELADSYPASKVMLSDGVTSVEDALDAHTFGTAVDITSYTSSSKYTCPSDGYIFLDATAISITNGTISVAIDGSNPILWGAARKSFIESIIISVRKGMQIYVANIDTGGKAYFYPLT